MFVYNPSSTYMDIKLKITQAYFIAFFISVAEECQATGNQKADQKVAHQHDISLKLVNFPRTDCSRIERLLGLGWDRTEKENEVTETQYYFVI